MLRPLGSLRCRRAITVLVIWATVTLASTIPTGATEIWLGAMYRTRDENAKWTSQSDFMQMFQPNAPWQKAASHVKVLLVSANVLLAASDAELQQVFSDIKQRGIVLGAEMGLLTGSHECGFYACNQNDTACLTQCFDSSDCILAMCAGMVCTG